MNAPTSKRRVLLVGWDAADWKIIHRLVDEGKMPIMARFIETGAIGNLATLDPPLSPMLWTSIASGKRAYHHGILGFTEVDEVTATVRPVNAASRRCRLVWEMLAERGLSSNVVGWFATHGEQLPGGSIVSDLYSLPRGEPGQPWKTAARGTYCPTELTRELDALRVAPDEIDESVIGMFVPEWRRVNQDKDRRLNTLQRYLAECLSYQAATTWLLEHRPADLTAVYFRAIDEISHVFMRFYPPRMASVPQTEFELYHQVVEATYRLHDMMLGRLIALAGDGTTVMLVSDHGFHSDHLRPVVTPQVPAGIAYWHREHGVFAVNGPEVAQDTLIHGADLLDVTPTLLTLFDLPVGRDMEGKVLRQVFEQAPAVRWTDSWERPDGAGTGTGSLELTADENQALVDQFAELGYIDKPSGDGDDELGKTRRENQWMLARACLDGRRDAEALPLLEALYEELPERVDFAQYLAACQQNLGLIDEAGQTIEAAMSMFSDRSRSLALKARIMQQSGGHEDALVALEAAERLQPEDASIGRLMAITLLALRRWDEAVGCCERMLVLDPHDAMAWLGIAHARYRQRDYRRAADAALTATGLDYSLPLAHFNLGLALMRLDDRDNALVAFRTASRLSPGLTAAHRWLEIIHRDRGEDRLAQDHMGRRLKCWSRRQRSAGIVETLRHESEQRRVIRQAERRSLRQASVQVADAESAAGQAPGRGEFVVVSGLPRSGTSLMMQMLQRGGMAVMSDHIRQADDDNREGYFEWEAIRGLATNPRLIDQAEGKVVKVVSMLLPYLPEEYNYKVIFMRRPLNQVAASQYKMRHRREAGGDDAVSGMQAILEKHLDATLHQLHDDSRFDVLEIDYPALVANPGQASDELVGFLGGDRLPDPDRMQGVVRQDLFRHR